MAYFPDNVASNYRVKMHDDFPILNAPGEYECAVSEIILPTKFQNIPKRQRIRIGGRAKGVILFNIEWFIEPGTYTIPKLIGLYNAKYGNVFKMRYDKARGKTHIISIDSDTRIARVELDEYLAHILGFKQVNTYGEKGKKRVESPFASSIQGLTALYIYTDIITGQFVGEVRAPLLRIVNWSHAKKNVDTESIVFDRPIFCPLLTNRFDTIQIVVMDDKGEEIKFESGTVVVILEFRPKSI